MHFSSFGRGTALRYIPFLISGLALAACQDDNSRAAGPEPVTEGESPPTAGYVPPPALDCDAIGSVTPPASAGFDALPGGFWNGTITDVTRNGTSYLEAWIDETGRFRMLYYPASNEVFTGTLDISGNHFAAAGRAIANPFNAWSDGSYATDVSIDGVIAEDDWLAGHWSAASGDNGCFELFYYDFAYTEEAAVAFLAGVWTDFGGRYDNLVLTVDPSGDFFGQDRDGCTWSGQFGLIDDRYNLYETSVGISDCDLAGTYTGLAYRGYVFAPERTLVMSVDDGERSLFVYLED